MSSSPEPPKEKTPFCYKKITEGNKWGRGLCCCPGRTKLCCMSFWCPCWVFGRIAERVGEPCGRCCCFSLLACAGCWAGMRVRGRVREKFNIEGRWQNDCAHGYFCGICSLIQMAQEIDDHMGFDVHNGPKKKKKNPNKRPILAPGEVWEDERKVKGKSRSSSRPDHQHHQQESRVDDIDDEPYDDPYL